MMSTNDAVHANHTAARIIVIGVGGCGLNSVKHLIQSGVQGVKYLCLDTDAVALANVCCSRNCQVVLSGLPATHISKSGSANMIVRRHLTGLPTTSLAMGTKEVTDKALQEVFATIFGADLLFLTAGLGGRTGSTLAPVIAKMARELGIPAVGVVFLPFDFEGARSISIAKHSLGMLDVSLTMMSVISNQKLTGLPEDTSQDAAFDMANDVLKNTVVAMLDIGSSYRKVLDTKDGFAHKVMLNHATSIGPHRAAVAMGMALDCPLLENHHLYNAKCILIKLTAAPESLHPSQFTSAKNIVLTRISPNAKLIIQSVCDERLDDEVHIAVLAVGM